MTATLMRDVWQRSDFDRCRDVGHGWELKSSSLQLGAALHEQQLQCSRCDTVRHRWLDRDGYVIRTWYSYAEGYLTPGQGRMTAARRAAYRLRTINSY